MFTIKVRNIGVKIHWAEVSCACESVQFLERCLVTAVHGFDSTLFVDTQRTVARDRCGNTGFTSFTRTIHRWRAAWQLLKSWQSSKWIVDYLFLRVHPESSSPSSQQLPLDTVISEISSCQMVTPKCQSLLYDAVKSGTHVSKFRRYQDTLKNRQFPTSQYAMPLSTLGLQQYSRKSDVHIGIPFLKNHFDRKIM